MAGFVWEATYGGRRRSCSPTLVVLSVVALGGTLGHMAELDRVRNADHAFDVLQLEPEYFPSSTDIKRLIIATSPTATQMETRGPGAWLAGFLNRQYTSCRVAESTALRDYGQ